MKSWQSYAARLAADVLHPQSRWWDAVTTTPRHLLVPRWFARDHDGEAWELRDGPSDQDSWMDAAYCASETLVTRIGSVHADRAEPGMKYRGSPTSSSTLPLLAIILYRLARLYDGADVLDVGTGSGYGCGLLTRRLGAEHVTSVDVDPYLTQAAAERLASIGLRPAIAAMDATCELPGSYDRIVPMVSMPAVPASWLIALRPGGRLVFCLAASSVVISAVKTRDGGACGRVEPDCAWFMSARHGPNGQDRGSPEIPAEIQDASGTEAGKGRYPVVPIGPESDLDPMLAVTAPGTAHGYDYDPDTDVQTAWMLHDDGSWARAVGKVGELPVVHQAGPRRLWDILDDIRHCWIINGSLPVRSADVQIDPDGTCHLAKGDWQAIIPGAT